MEPDDILDANKHRYVPLTWERPDGTPVKYVKRAPCSGAWVDAYATPDARGVFPRDEAGEVPIERLPGPFVARWQRDTKLWASPDDVEPLRTAKAGEVATEADMRLWLVDREAAMARAGSGPSREECLTKFIDVQWRMAEPGDPPPPPVVTDDDIRDVAREAVAQLRASIARKRAAPQPPASHTLHDERCTVARCEMDPLLHSHDAQTVPARPFVHVRDMAHEALLASLSAAIDRRAAAAFAPRPWWRRPFDVIRRLWSRGGR